MKDDRVSEELTVKGPDRGYVTIIVRFLMRYGWQHQVLVKPSTLYQIQDGTWVYKVELKSKTLELIEEFKARARHEIRKALRREN